MTVRLELAEPHAGHSFFRVGLEMLFSDFQIVDRFFPTLDGFHGHAQNRSDRARMVLESFLKKDVSNVVLRTSTLEDVSAFCWFVLDECAARREPDVPRASNPNGIMVAAGRSFHLSREPGELPPHLPFVVSDTHVCYGCGKKSKEELGFSLAIGPYDVPCCAGRDHGFKRTCRLEAMANLGCCVSCGRMSTKLGKICSSCSSLVADGEKARKERGARVAISVSGGGKLKYDTRKKLIDSLVGMGASHHSSGADPTLSLPEEVAPVVEDLLRTLDADLEREYQVGLQRGKNLLLGLAEGSVSVADFNQGSR
jgi:hypothetical protein